MSKKLFFKRHFLFHVVLVPAGTFTNLRTKEPIDWNNYNDVKKKLNIKGEEAILVK